MVKTEDLVYETDIYKYNFQRFETIWSFAKNIYVSKITLDDADKTQSDLLNEFPDFKKGTRPRNKKKRKLKRDAVKSKDAPYKVREMVLNAFKSGIFPLQRTEGKGNPGMPTDIAEVSDREVSDHTNS